MIAAQPTAVTVIRWVGAAFLPGYAMLAGPRAVRPARLTPRPTARDPARDPADLPGPVTYLNPHVYLDTVLLLGSVAQQHPHPWLFGIGAALASAVWFTALGPGRTGSRPCWPGRPPGGSWTA